MLRQATGAIARAGLRQDAAGSRAAWACGLQALCAPAAATSAVEAVAVDWWRVGFGTSAAAQAAASAPASATSVAGSVAGAATAAASAAAVGLPPSLPKRPAGVQLSPLDQSGLPPVYHRLDDPITGPYKVPQKAVFAVVELGGTQYKVTPDDLVICEKLSGLDINDKVELGRVLLLGSRTETVIGRPYVPDARVIAAVEEQFLDGKVLIFHKRRRKNSRRLRGHRQPLTTLRILEVHGIEEDA